MDQGSLLFQSRLSPLPVEIRQAILCEIPNVTTLEAALKADDSLRTAFLGSASSILENILLNSIPSELFPEALAILNTSCLDKAWSRESVHEILHHYFLRKPRSVGWTLSDAKYVDEAHRHIDFFTDHFASYALAIHPVSGKAEPSRSPLSYRERCRIQGTFYRFELFSRLFRSRGKTANFKFSAHEQYDVFLRHFSPWENEQLGSVHDYLYAQVTPHFNDVAEHDIEWGEFSIPFHDHDDCFLQCEERIDYVISLGLPYLRRLLCTTTFEERRELLGDYPMRDDDFLLNALLSVNDGTDEPPVWQLCQYSEQMIAALHSWSCLKQDPDPGPYNAWYWAHADECDDTFIFHTFQRPLRKRGYVMWDDDRLRAWKLFDKPFDENAYDDRKLSPHGEEKCQEEVDESFRRRSEIWMKGGRGWWSKDDESKVVWPRKREQSSDSKSTI